MRFLSVGEVERDNYKFLSGSILPRPIALVTTLQENGKVNVAPFSYFNIVSSSPPLISISVRYDTDKQKDTSRNIFREKEFVVHVISESFVDKANKTSISLGEQESEMAYAKLSEVSSKMVRVPGIKESKIRLECVYETHMNFASTDLVIGRVVGYWIDEDIFEDGKIDYEKLNPVSRLSGSRYGLIGKVIHMKKEG